MNDSWGDGVAPPLPQRRPQLAIITYAIIALCTAIWLCELTLPGFFQQVALSAALGRIEPWRMITSAFAHSLSPLHILCNMFALWSVGRVIELGLGRARFAALYLISALGGSVGYILLALPPISEHPMGVNWFNGVVGASGAVFGLLGALVAMYRHVGAPLQQLGGVLVVNTLVSFAVPNIAWQAHLGGFLVGLAAGQLMMLAVRRTWRGEHDRTWQWLGMVTLALVVLVALKYTV